MQFSPIEIWNHMGLPALVIAALLLLMGLASLTVLTERLITLRLSHQASRRFAESIVRDMEAGDIEAIITRAAEPQYTRGHLTRILQHGLTAYRHARLTADIGGLPAAERAHRDVDRFMEEISADLRRGMAVLSSVGSTAPFVGLLGTVVAHDQAASADTLPWLLLSTKSFGKGALGGVSYVQRVNTRGGMPPPACGADQSNRLLRVDFTADFVFYRPRS